MPEGSAPSPDLERLRQAYARRLLARLVEASGHAYVAQALVRLHRLAPERAARVLLDPSFSVLVETGSLSGALATASLSLAHEGALGAERRGLGALRTIVSAHAGVRAQATRTIALADGTVWLDGAATSLYGVTSGAGVERPFPEIAGRLSLALHDVNPLALHETHPDKDGNALSLGDKPLEAWLGALREALGIVEAHLPGLAAEMQAMLRLVIPVGASDEKHLSASYREYVGAVYLTLHREPLTMAEALVHEFQHNKLNLLSFHYPILENGYDFLYRSPVRPDPRPLMGILLAAHAFVPVAELYRRVLDAGATRDEAGLRARFAQVVARNDEALTVLERHGRPARAGELLLARLRAIHRTHLGVVRDLPENVSHVA